MGVIQKQSIRGTVYTYGGAVLGFIISGILFPNYLSTSQIGVINVVVSYSTIFALLASLGFLSTTTKFFPFFRNKEKRHNGFIFLGSTVSFIGFLLTLCVFLLLKPIITRSGIGDNVLFEQYTDLIIPLAFFILYFNFFDYINKDLFQATRGLFLRDFLMRILIIGSTFLFAYNFVDFDDFTNLYILVYSIPVIVLIFYLIVDGNFSLRPSRKFLNKSLVKNMISVSFFGILTSSTGIITQHIDRIMVKDLLNFSEAGIYTTCFFFGTLVALPSRALIRISSSVIADSFKQGNLMLIKNIYSKSVLNQFIIGLYLFIGIWVNIDSIFVILGEEFISGKWVIFLISIAFLTDMLSGTSSNIIGNSAFYRFQSIFMTIMVAIVIVTNIIFIPLYGIVGAALSSLIAKLIFNLLKFFFLWKKLDLQPYDKKILISVLIALITMIIGVIIPSNSYFIFDILIRSIAVSIIFGCSIYYSKVSVDINKFILQLKEKLI